MQNEKSVIGRLCQTPRL